MYGDLGDDILYAGPGVDLVNGGPGHDEIVVPGPGCGKHAFDADSEDGVNGKNVYDTIQEKYIKCST